MQQQASSVTHPHQGRCESPIVVSHEPRPSGGREADIVLNIGGMNVIQDHKSDSSASGNNSVGGSASGGSDAGGSMGHQHRQHQHQNKQQHSTTTNRTNNSSSNLNSAANSIISSGGSKKSKKKKVKKGILSVALELSHAQEKLKSLLTGKESNIIKIIPSPKKKIDKSSIIGQFEDAAEPDQRNSGQMQYQNSGNGGYSSPPFGYFSLHPTTLSLHPPSATYNFYPSTPMMGMGTMGGTFGQNSFQPNNGFRANPFGGFPNAANGMSNFPHQRFPAAAAMNFQQQQKQQTSSNNSQMSPNNNQGMTGASSQAAVLMEFARKQQYQQQQHQQQKQLQFQHQQQHQQQKATDQKGVMAQNNNVSSGGQVPIQPSMHQDSSSGGGNHNSTAAASFNSRPGAMSAMMALAAAREKNDPAAAAALLGRLQAQRSAPPPPPNMGSQMGQQHTPQPLMDEMRAFSAAVQQQQQQKELRDRQVLGMGNNQMSIAPRPPHQSQHERKPIVHDANEPPFYVDGEIVPSLIDNDVANMDKLPMLPSVHPDRKKENPVKEEQITHCDVLLGRGGMTNHHVGNMHFRTLVNKHKMHYVQAKKGDKGMLSKKLTNYVRHKNGRFLQKNDSDNLFYEVGDSRAHAKFAQALREGTADVVRQMMEKEGSDDGTSVSGADDSSRNNIRPAAAPTVSAMSYSQPPPAFHPALMLPRSTAVPNPPTSAPSAPRPVSGEISSPRCVIAEDDKPQKTPESSKPRKTPIRIVEDRPEKLEFEQAVRGMVGQDDEARRKRLKIHHVESESESENEEEIDYI